MRNKIFFPLYSLLMLLAFVACNDDDKQPVPFLDLSKQNLTLTEGVATTSTFTFDVQASDASIPYLCLYVDKATIDQIPKGELPSYLMNDLKKQADAQKKSYEEYVASLAMKGNQSGLKVENLVPGRIYELVAFAVDGVRPVEKAEYLFFQTLKADYVDCTFGVEVIEDELKANEASLQVSPSDKEVLWFMGGMPKQGYDQSVGSGQYDDASIMIALLNQQLEHLLGQLVPPGGELTSEILEKALGMLLIKGDAKVTFQGLTANTEYKWLAAAFARVNTDDGDELVLVSDVGKGDFMTKEQSDSGLTFEVEVSDIKAVSAHVKVTPSDLQARYAFSCVSVTEETKGLTDEELMNWYVEKNQNNLNMPWGTVMGVQDVPNMSCVPGKEHYVLVFGYNKGITSKPVVKRFTTEQGGDASKVTFSYSDVVASPYQITMTVTPSDLTVPCAAALEPSAKFDKQEFINRAQLQVKNDYEQYKRLNPGVSMTEFLYSSSTYAPGVKSPGIYDGLQQGVAYTLCAFTVDTEGKLAAVQEVKDVVTVPGLSDASVNGEVVAYFNGDDEGGKIFGNAENSKGKVIVAMKYVVSQGAKEPKASLMVDNAEMNELNPEEVTDKYLIKTYVWPWNEIGKSGYQFVVCDWEKLYYSFAYAKDAKGVEGKVSRLEVPAMHKDGVRPIEELQKLVDEANAAETQSLFATGLTRPVADLPVGEAIRVPFRYEEVPAQHVASQSAAVKDIQPNHIVISGLLPVANPVRIIK